MRSNFGVGMSELAVITGSGAERLFPDLVSKGSVETTYGTTLTTDDTNVYTDYIEMSVESELPIVHEIQCQDQAAGWVNCSDIQYGDTLLAVRANCTYSMGSVANLSFNLTNVHDGNTFFLNNGSYDSGWWVFNNSDLTIEDSGDFDLDVRCFSNHSIV